MIIKKHTNRKGEIKMNTVIFAKGKDVQEQIEHCKAYADMRGYDVVGVIVGQGRDLPDVIKSLDMNIDIVLVGCMSRISRNALECYTIQADIELESGTRIEVATDQPHDEAINKFMKNVIMAVREEELKEREREMRKELILSGIMNV